MRTKKGKDLKVGDILKKHGLVIKVDLNPDPDGFWRGMPFITYFDINDSYYGPSSTYLDINKDFEIYTERKDIIKVLETIDCDLATYIADTIETRKNFHEIQQSIVNKLNKIKKQNQKNRTNK